MCLGVPLIDCTVVSAFLLRDPYACQTRDVLCYLDQCPCLHLLLQLVGPTLIYPYRSREMTFLAILHFHTAPCFFCAHFHGGLLIDWSCDLVDDYLLDVLFGVFVFLLLPFLCSRFVQACLYVSSLHRVLQNPSRRWKQQAVGFAAREVGYLCLGRTWLQSSLHSSGCAKTEA